jgi:putative DNA primase/helicase
MTTIPEYQDYQADFDRKMHLNLARNATQSAQGDIGFKGIKPSLQKGVKDDVYPENRRLGVIEPLSNGIRNNPGYNHYMSHALFRGGSNSQKAEDVVGHYGWAADSDDDNGKPVVLPQGLTPPSLVIRSSMDPIKGTENRQLWWFFTRIISAAEGLKLGDLIYRKLGGDPCTSKPAQVYRIAGSNNNPGLSKIERGRSPERQPAPIVGGTRDPVDPDVWIGQLEKLPDGPWVAGGVAEGPRSATDKRHAPRVQPGDLERVREMLPFIPADDYDTWLDVGMILHAHFGDASRGEWDDWARRSSKFDPADQEKKWRSFNPNGNASGCKGFGSLVNIAKGFGYQAPGANTASSARFAMRLQPAAYQHGATARKLEEAPDVGREHEAEADEAEAKAALEALLDPDTAKAEKAERRRAAKQAEKEAHEQATREALDEAKAQAKEKGLPELPRGFRHADDLSVGYWVPGKEKSAGYWAELCTPIKFVGAYRDPDNGSWGHLVEVMDPDGEWHRATISHAQSAKDHKEVMALLADRGLVMYGQNGKFRFLELAAVHLKTIEGRVRCVSQTGWHTARDGGEYFVLPNQVYGPSEGEEIVCQPKGVRGADYCVNGTLEGWQDGIAKLAIGNSRLTLAIAAAFAAPLLKPMGMQGGGFNFRGSSSTGKTSILGAAASVCGGPDYIKSWRTTDNALERTAEAHCDMLLPMDELAQIEPKAAGNSAYMLTNGEGKQRMNADATMKKTAKWRTIVLSTGEISLADKIEEGGGKAMAGQAARVIDIAADAGCGHGIFEKLHGFNSGAQLADAIRACSATHFGIAADEYLSRLTDDLKSAREKVRAYMDAFEASACPEGADGQVKRVCKRFALVAAAAELATGWGITGWSSEEATKAAKKCFKAWLAERGGIGAQETTNALSRIRLIIEQHGNARFQVWGSDKNASGGQVSNQLGYVKPDESEYYFSTEAFTAEVCKGLDIKVVCKALRQIKALNSDGDRNQKSCRVPIAWRRVTEIDSGGNEKVRSVPIVGQRKLYVIKAEQLFNPPDSEENSGGEDVPF